MGPSNTYIRNYLQYKMIFEKLHIIMLDMLNYAEVVYNYIIAICSMHTCHLDINECAGDHGCHHLCNNTDGSFHCYCNPGYMLVNGTNCTG